MDEKTAIEFLRSRGFVCLTAEEAAVLDDALSLGAYLSTGEQTYRGGEDETFAEARALLTPDPEIFAPRDPHTYVTHEPDLEREPMDAFHHCTNACDHDDIGPPAPGEGDDLPNPEIGMEC